MIIFNVGYAFGGISRVSRVVSDGNTSIDALKKEIVTELVYDTFDIEENGSHADAIALEKTLTETITINSIEIVEITIDDKIDFKVKLSNKILNNLKDYYFIETFDDPKYK